MALLPEVGGLETTLRVGWPSDRTLMLFSHTHWNAEDERVTSLSDHPLYNSAKRRRNARAALSICDEICRDYTLDCIQDACLEDGRGDLPIVVAPALSLDETQNALAIGYAKWLANELRWECDSALFQRRTVSRDFVTDGWFRLVNEPEFYGQVQPGRRYVIADDVCTMGGTMASLRGYIEASGGRVVCTTTLASRDGSHAQFSLAERTLSRLSSVHGGALPAVFREEFGYELTCVTEHEGRFLLRCQGLDAFRAGVHGARNP